MKGWIHNIRDHKKILFVQLYTDKVYLQLVFTGSVLTEHRADITLQAAIEVTGDIVANPKSPTDGIEMKVTGFKLLGAGSDTFASEINSAADVHTRMTKRHLLHWSDAVDSTARECTKLWQQVYLEVVKYYSTHGFTKVEPPTIVDIQTEGGSTLFSLDYYGKKAYLTQSSQMYLEAVMPGYGAVWCYESSYRAEKSSTPRHLAEYKHLEAELPFVTFEDLIVHIETLVRTLVLSAGHTDVVDYTKPFMRMTHREAVDKLRELGFCKSDSVPSVPYSYTDDLPDSAEGRLLEEYKCPIFITHFPAEIKSFYMKKYIDADVGAGTDATAPVLTESVDLLLPGVGETVGGSMRMTDYGELMQAFKEQKIDPGPYYWYTDLRKYGSCEHGGYGLGKERLIKAIRYAQGKPIDHVREACLFPRYFR